MEAVKDNKVRETEITDGLIRGYFRDSASPTTSANDQATAPSGTSGPGPAPSAEPSPEPSSALTPVPTPTAAPNPLRAERRQPPDFVTVPLEDPRLPALLDQHNVEYRVLPPEVNWFGVLLNWLVPPLLLIGGFWLLTNAQGRGTGVMSIGKSKARLYAADDAQRTRFSDVAGVDEAKAELQEVVDFLKFPERYSQLGGKVPKGVLLIGPPGTGKTLLAKAVAGEAGVPFFALSGSDFVEMFVGVGSARVRDLFAQAQKQAPCIVFIDELDALGRSRGGNPLGSNEEREQTLNQLLVQMDGFASNSGIILLAATNRPESLDPALRRAGRFDRQVLVDRPDVSGREAILKVHVREVKLAEGVDLAKIAARTPGFAGADLANLVNEATLLAGRNQRSGVMMTDFEEAIERVIAGLERKSRVLNSNEKVVVAYHEVGHAIVGALMPGADPVTKISIIPRGASALGYTLQLPTEDRFLMEREELLGRITTLLGGRAAEEVTFGRITSGASNDIERATQTAILMVTQFGMSKLGPVNYEQDQGGFLEASQKRRMVSEKTAQAIDQEVSQIIDACHQRAVATLRENQALLVEMAEHLLEREILDGPDLLGYLKRSVPLPAANS
ncbi:ATP-dependent zinc metalloprotease FtsH [Leptolyngbya sp. FACHB-261]|nr:ATP-dependent zinc metalloprotease FtsH [Leptolyngbya sp. FACHB-261]